MARRGFPGLLVALGGVAGLVALSAVTAWPAAASQPVHQAKRSAAVRQIATSPSTSVVAGAPQAVSVTFSGPLSAQGASLRIFGPDGEVSAAQTQIVGNAVRRTLDQDVPSGPYEVRWTVRSAGGDRLTGSFSFVAARGHGDSQQGAGQQGAGQAVPDSSPAGVPSALPSVLTTGPGVDRVLAGPSRSTALSARLRLVPIGLVVALVLASTVVGMVARPRRPRRPELLVHRGLALPWQRHQQ